MFLSSVILKVSCNVWFYISFSKQPFTWGVLEHAGLWRKGKCTYQALCGISGHQLAFSATKFVTFCSSGRQSMFLAKESNCSCLKCMNKDISQ